MYIACPKCGTRFVVSSSQIGEYGRKVKCSKCAHIWHQKIDDAVKIEPVLINNTSDLYNRGNQKFAKGINLPALLPINIPKYLYVMPVILVCIVALMSVVIFPNRSCFETVFNNENLSIRDIQIIHHKDIDKISVSYKIFNSSQSNVEVPLVRVRLLDSNKRVLKTRIHDSKNMNIVPNQFLYIKTEFFNVPKNTDNIDIMLGNRLDFLIL